jgi:hypothetical protein
VDMTIQESSCEFGIITDDPSCVISLI